MHLEQRFELPQPPAVAWPAFRDIGMLVDCLPGAALTGPAVGGELPMRFDVRLGPIAAGFVGRGRATFDDEAQSGRFEGAASDRKTNSRVKGSADFAVAAGGAGSVVTLRVDYALSGSLAQLSRGGIVRELASMLTAQFAANLEARLAASPPRATMAGELRPDAARALARDAPSAQGSVPSATSPDMLFITAPGMTSATAANMASASAREMAYSHAAVAARAPAAAPLDGGRLLRRALRGWWMRWWRRLAGQR
jgi:carbon monoxide dehydrogenase subunit G